jgi:hypothetical protein
MNSREKRLAIGLAIVFGLLGSYYLYDIVMGKFNDREKKIAQWKKTISDNQVKIDDGNLARKKMNDWDHRSLPTDEKIAASKYEDWLIDLVNGAHFESPTVGLQPTNGQSTTYKKYGFEIKADADMSMKPVVDFLFKFYASGQLQKIRQLMIKPHIDGKALDVTIDIEALLLPGADRSDKLSDEKLNELTLGDLTKYEKIIDDRKLFEEYEPPRSVRTVVRNDPRQPPPIDVAKYAIVTGITEQDDQAQVLVLVKTTGELLTRSEGEDFTVGNVNCKVVKIGIRDVVLNVDGKLVQVHCGDNLRDGVPVSAEEDVE